MEPHHPFSEQPKVAELLIQNGANLNAVGHDGRTALSWAAQMGMK